MLNTDQGRTARIIRHAAADTYDDDRANSRVYRIAVKLHLSAAYYDGLRDEYETRKANGGTPARTATRSIVRGEMNAEVAR